VIPGRRLLPRCFCAAAPIWAVPTAIGIGRAPTHNRHSALTTGSDAKAGLISHKFRSPQSGGVPGRRDGSHRD
jgi:hypothetical protein